MKVQIKCGSEGRRQVIRDPRNKINGIDYVEVYSRDHSYEKNVDDDSRNDHDLPHRSLLLLHFFKRITTINKNNIFLEGGIDTRPIKVEWATPADETKDYLSTGRDVHNLSVDNRNNLIVKDLSNHERNIIREIKEPDHVLLIRPDRDGDLSRYVLRIVQDE